LVLKHQKRICIDFLAVGWTEVPRVSVCSASVDHHIGRAKVTSVHPSCFLLGKALTEMGLIEQWATDENQNWFNDRDPQEVWDTYFSKACNEYFNLSLKEHEALCHNG
jgi:hypothetical protein